MRAIHTIALLCACFLTGVAAFATSTAPCPTRSKKAVKKPAKRQRVLVEDLFQARTGPVPRRAKLFLFAGSSLAASFAREIVAQRKLWLAAGFQEDEIACYYVVPLQEDLDMDRERFLEVAPELKPCYAASVKLLGDHLREIAAASEAPPFLYLYFTSHGERPVSYALAEAKPTDENYFALKREARYAIFDQYHLLVEGLPDGTATAQELLGALRGGAKEEELFLTPRHLKGLLSEGFAKVPKYVVLQGCYTGGFIDEPKRPELAREALSALSDITVLAASRHDRASFGCEPGGKSTFFGGAFFKALEKRAQDPRRLDWEKLSEEVRAHIEHLERKEKVRPPSLPQFFTNRAPGAR